MYHTVYEGEHEKDVGLPQRGCCFWIWESIMSLVALFYTAIIVYQYNKEGSVRMLPTPAPQPVVMAGSPRRLAEVLTPCEIDFTQATLTQGIVNFTLVCAIFMVLDQLRTLILTCCRKGNLWYYFAYPDNVFNLATTVVQCFSAGGVVVPNSVGMVSRIFARSWACTPAFCNRVPRDLDQYGEHDNTVCDFLYRDGVWEVIMFAVSFFQLLQTIVMPITLCQAGPTQAISELAHPPVDYVKNMDNESTVILDSAFIIGIGFCVNIFIQLFCAASFWPAIKDASVGHNMVIAFQTVLFQLGLPVPTMLGRAVRPLFVFFGCAGHTFYKPIDEKTARRYESALDEYKRSKKVAPLEEGDMPCGCGRKDFDKWTC